MNVPMTMVDASTSVSVQKVPIGVNATVATTYRKIIRVARLVLNITVLN